MSALVTGTLGWTAASQRAWNEKSGEGATAVTLLLLEKDADGVPTGRVLPGVDFYLYQIVRISAGFRASGGMGAQAVTTADVQIGGRYTTGADGTLTVPDLLPGDYYFLSVRPAPRHGFDIDDLNFAITRYDFTISGDEEYGELEVIAYHRLADGPLTVRKFVENEDGTPIGEDQAGEEFTFTVAVSNWTDGPIDAIFNGEERQLSAEDSAVSFVLKHGDSIDFPGMIVGMAYRVTEEIEPGYVLSADGHRGNIPQEGAEAVFTNTYYEALDTEGSVTVTKTVTGQGADLARRFDFTAAFTDGGGGTVPDPVRYRVNGGAARDLPADGGFTLGHGDSLTFLNLPRGIGYTVTEDTATPYVPNHYDYAGTVTGGNTVLPFVNFHDDGNTMRMDGFLQITKEVTGDGADTDRDFIFDVTLTDSIGQPLAGSVNYVVSNDGLPDSSPFQLLDGRNGETAGQVTLKHGQTAIFDALAHGTRYTVTEQAATGYVCSIQSVDGVIADGQTADLIFVNERILTPPSVPDASLTVRKEVVGEIMPRDAGREYGFALFIDGAQEEEFTLSDGETFAFDGIPAGAVYEVREEDYTADEFYGAVENGYGIANGENIEVVQANTFAGNVTTTVSGEKTWDLNGHTPALPGSIEVVLKNAGRDIVVERAAVTPDVGGRWLYEWTAPKYEADGVTEIRYTVEETPIESWKQIVTGYNIRNVYFQPLTVGDTEVRKALEGNPPANAVFRFAMSARGGAPMPTGSGNGIKVIDIVGAGSGGFGGITYTAPGTYEYTISEINTGVDNYTYDASVYTLTIVITEENNALTERSRTLTRGGAPAAQAVFTNRYADIPLGEKVVISGSKTWNHGGNAQADRPQAITVILNANGVPAAQRSVTAADGWGWSFTMNRYDASGREISYTIDEAAVPGYAKQISGYDVTNTYGSGNWGADPAKTGDDSNVRVWIALMAVSLVGIVVTLMAGRRARRRRGRKDAVKREAAHALYEWEDLVWRMEAQRDEVEKAAPYPEKRLADAEPDTGDEAEPAGEAAQPDDDAPYTSEMDAIRAMAGSGDYRAAADKAREMLDAGRGLPESERRRIEIMIRLLEEKRG